MSKLNLEIELLSVFSLSCENPELEERLFRQFLSGMELCSWQETDLLETKYFDFDADLDLPSGYFRAIGLSKRELEESDNVTYFQVLWNIQGVFSVNPSKLEEFAYENFYLDFTSIVPGVVLLGENYNDGVVLKVISVALKD